MSRSIPLLLLAAAAFLVGTRLAFAGGGLEFHFFLNRLGVFLMFAGLLSWLTAVSVLLVRIGSWKPR